MWVQVPPSALRKTPVQKTGVFFQTMNIKEYLQKAGFLLKWFFGSKETLDDSLKKVLIISITLNAFILLWLLIQNPDEEEYYQIQITLFVFTSHLINFLALIHERILYIFRLTKKIIVVDNITQVLVLLSIIILIISYGLMNETGFLEANAIVVSIVISVMILEGVFRVRNWKLKG